MLNRDIITPENDGSIDIYTCVRRTQKQLRRESIQWSSFVKRISETHRTPETFKQFKKAAKTDQGVWKDQGGFVGGTLAGGSRKTGSVISRSLITLDADSGKIEEVWDNIIFEFGVAACCYTTHSHCPENNRFRIIIPLREELSRDEYEPVARYVAGVLGIEAFDNSTYESARLMYWPSSSKDGEYDWRCTDGPWLDGKKILTEAYKDWTDSSEWPVSKSADSVMLRKIKKQENPLEKEGVVGTFCRTYNIHEAIEAFLDDVYVECDVENRYTYKEGSTAAGLIVYDDLFAYSHHSTDPIYGKECNSFDLVRIHKFRHLDENAHEKTNITKLPSYMAMLDLATQDIRVRRQLADEKLHDAGEDFAELYGKDEGNSEWISSLDTDRKGNYLSTAKNVRLIMENDPNLKGLFANDKFSKRIALLRLPFWRKPDDNDMFFNDADEAEIRLYLANDPWEIKAKGDIQDVILSIGARNAFHPVKRYLDSLVWDGEKRVETVFIEGLGAEDSEYARVCTRKMFIAGVNRIMDPGCYMDYVLVLIGEEGQGKSKLLSSLSKSPKWFVDSFSVEGKDAYENIRGKWIVEIAELVALKKADSNVVKNFVSKTSDFYRAAYDKYPQDQPRQCVFFGSGNDIHFLRGIGGDRRFWPIEISKDRKIKNWSEFADYEIDQIWAEAKHYYLKGEKPVLPENIEKIAKQKQREHIEVDSWEDEINEFLDKLLPEDWKTNTEASADFFETAEGTAVRDSVTTKEIWQLCFNERKPIDYQSQKRIANIMNRKQDWEYIAHRRSGKHDKKIRGWRKKS